MADLKETINAVEALSKSMSQNQCYACSHEFVELAKNFGTNIVEDALELLKDYKTCVNELCLECGHYKQEHEGACADCRWLRQRRGW